MVTYRRFIRASARAILAGAVAYSDLVDGRRVVVRKLRISGGELSRSRETKAETWVSVRNGFHRADKIIERCPVLSVLYGATRLA